MTKEQLYKYPATDKCRVVDTIGVPHPYCITPKHVAIAADQFAGMLTEEAIRVAETQGARCDICKGQLKYSEHKQALLVEVATDTPIDEINKYIQLIADQTAKDGYSGWAFKERKN
jgi:hypothetical protein